MRIKRNLKKSGFFWLPSSPERKLPGILSISDGGDIDLEVVGLFDESEEALNCLDDNDNLKRIIGYIEIDYDVTLDDCTYIRKIIGNISKSFIKVNKAFIGVAYDENENIFLNTFRFSIEGIEEWVGINGFDVKNQRNDRTIIINYKLPDDISLILNNGMQLMITFSASPPISPYTTKAEISQKTYFKLVSAEERELNDFISIAEKITTFLCLAIDDIVCIEHVTATSDNILQDIGDGKSTPVPIKIYYSSIPYTKYEPNIEWPRMLFRYMQIQNDAERLINNWIDAYNKIDPTLYLYFSIKMGAHKYLVGKFLALVQGLESYHRRTSDEKMMNESMFKELVKNIVSHCPEEKQEWLEERLKHGNEISLSKRIKNIIEPFQDVVGSSTERSKIIRKIVDTRNYLTHYDESLESKAANGRDLWILCLKMEAFFQLHFLKVLGFTQEEIKSILVKGNRLNQKLNQK